MLDILTNTLALIFVLGVMIFVHEFGHFATAKYFGIRVDVFGFDRGERADLDDGVDRVAKSGD